MVSSEIGLLSDRTLLAFGIALSTAMLVAGTIKSAYLSYAQEPTYIIAKGMTTVNKCGMYFKSFIPPYACI